MLANPGMTRERAEAAALFARETIEALIKEHGSLEAALRAPGRSWSEIKKELGICSS